MVMDHWSDRWLGRPWQPGKWECFHCALAALSALRVSERPEFVEAAREAQAASWQQRARILDGLTRHTIQIPPHEVEEGDVITMRHPGGSRAGHIGVAVDLGSGGIHCLHCTDEAGTVRHSIGNLVVADFEVHGFWRIGR